jgi:hypothetical protein
MVTRVIKRGEGVDKVVEAVILKQGDTSNDEIAKKIGITNVMWSYLKSGKRKPGKKFYTGVMRAFPDLIPTVLMAMTVEEGE